MRRNTIQTCRTALVASAVLLIAIFHAAAADLTGTVQGAKQPIAGSTVTFFAAGTGAPTQLAQGKTDDSGAFTLTYRDASVESVLYVIAQGGTPNASKGPNAAISLISILGGTPPKKIVVNEFTTIASAWTANQFLQGEKLSGKALGLRIAAGNIGNFVDLSTGGFGTTIQDGLNSSQTPTMVNFATLANILAGAITKPTPDADAQLFVAATSPAGAMPADTLAAVQNIIRYPGHQAAKVFALLDTYYPVAKGKKMRPAPFLPYLDFAPSAWVFPLKFVGGGVSGGGKLMIDSQGNVWVGNNFIVGGQSQAILWNGNLSKFAPNGARTLAHYYRLYRRRPPRRRIWPGHRCAGQRLGGRLRQPEHHQVRQQREPALPARRLDARWQARRNAGHHRHTKGDIWAVDQGGNQPSSAQGTPRTRASTATTTAKTRSPIPSGCSPFHLAIDPQERLWISNSIGSTVIRVDTANPTKMDKFDVGYGGSGLAIDSQGNVWHADRFGSSENGRLKLVELMAAYAIKGEVSATASLVHHLSAQKPGYWDGGSVTVLRPDGSKAPFSPVTGKGLGGPWAVAIDGNDDVWVSNFTSAMGGNLVHLCGVNPRLGMKTGDAISPPGGYVGGGMQQLVDVGIGPAGDVWLTNNWEIDSAGLGQAPEALSTRGAGQGVVVFFGMAKPVKTPLIGPVQKP